MPSEGYKPAIPATKLLHSYAVDRAATRIGKNTHLTDKNLFLLVGILVKKLLPVSEQNSGRK
jgi:hypothetical protein